MAKVRLMIPNLYQGNPKLGYLTHKGWRAGLELNGEGKSS